MNNLYFKYAKLYQRVTGYYQYNGHGDTVKIINSITNSVLASYDYDAFGNQKNVTENIYNPFRYCGEYADEESGLIYLRARYYEPGAGRFISEDPHWNPHNMIYGDDPNNTTPDISAIMQSSNLYIYCGSDPVNRCDPSGLYNRKAAVQYAMKYATYSWNYGAAMRFNNDCTNFVSNCLAVGGMKQSDDWYFKGAVQVGLPGDSKITGSYSKTWTVAEEQFKAFTNCTGEFPNANYGNGNAICFRTSTWIAESIQIYNIQPGDLIYWLDPKTLTMQHAAIIVSVDNGKIKYAQHDGNKNDGDLGDYLDTHPYDNGVDYTYAYVVRIRDDA